MRRCNEFSPHAGQPLLLSPHPPYLPLAAQICIDACMHPHSVGFSWQGASARRAGGCGHRRVAHAAAHSLQPQLLGDARSTWEVHTSSASSRVAQHPSVSARARRANARAMVGAPFARLLANLLVMGTGVLGRAFIEAYKQALRGTPFSPPLFRVPSSDARPRVLPTQAGVQQQRAPRRCGRV